MPTIERMNLFGRNYLITLDCGHAITRSKDEVKLQQLYIGKRLGCEECARAGAHSDKIKPFDTIQTRENRD